MTALAQSPLFFCRIQLRIWREVLKSVSTKATFHYVSLDTRNEATQFRFPTDTGFPSSLPPGAHPKRGGCRAAVPQIENLKRNTDLVDQDDNKLLRDLQPKSATEIG